MIAFLKGIIEKKDIDKVAIDVNGVGYEVLMPAGDVERLTVGQNTFINFQKVTVVKENFLVVKALT